MSQIIRALLLTFLTARSDRLCLASLGSTFDYQSKRGPIAIAIGKGAFGS